MTKPILDMASGAGMFYFDIETASEVVHFNDLNPREITACDGRIIKVSPDTTYDFRNTPFGDGSFEHVVFDPPHVKAGEQSFTSQHYGSLGDDWEALLRDGFAEAWRLCQDGGSIVFKWSTRLAKLNQIFDIIGMKPLYGTRVSKSKYSESWFLWFYKWPNLTLNPHMQNRRQKCTSVNNSGQKARERVQSSISDLGGVQNSSFAQAQTNDQNQTVQSPENAQATWDTIDIKGWRDRPVNPDIRTVGKLNNELLQIQTLKTIDQAIKDNKETFWSPRGMIDHLSKVTGLHRNTIRKYVVVVHDGSYGWSDYKYRLKPEYENV